MEDRRSRRVVLSEADQAFVDYLRTTFSAHATKNKRLTQASLKNILGIHNKYLTRRLFFVIDSDGDGVISFDDFSQTSIGLILGSDDVKLRFVFDLHDENADGKIHKAELERMFKACLTQNRLRVAPSELKAMVLAIFQKGDLKKDGKIDFTEFKALMKKFPQERQQLIQSLSVWFTGRPASRNRPPRRHFGSVIRALFNTLPSFLYRYALVIGYLVLNGWLFYDATVRYSDYNLYVRIARGCGACLNLNGALILFPMMRLFVTWIHQSVFSRFVPADKHVHIHKLIGYAIVLFSLVHGAAHTLNYLTLQTPLMDSLFRSSAGLTGVILTVVLVVMWLCTLSFIRRTGLFEVFWLTHSLYLGWFVVLYLHAPNFWKWATGPVILFVLEHLYRRLKRRHVSVIDKGESLKTGVSVLTIRRPGGFAFRPGDYVFLKIPGISRFEWHPFTISGGTAGDDFFTLHIRASGNWTRALHKLMSLPVTQRRLPVVIDGPYGTPSGRVGRHNHVVLVGAGIGVTPYASVLQSLLVSNKEKPKRVFFYWLNRGQKSFAWFASLLGELEAKKKGKRLSLNVYMTDAKINPTMGLLSVAMALAGKSRKVDLVTGLKTATKFGRPDWYQIFSGISRELGAKAVTVFFCGPYSLGRSVHKAAKRFGFRYREEIF